MLISWAFTEKSDRGRSHEKPIYRGNCLKRGLGKKREGEVDAPMHTMFVNSSVHLVKTSLIKMVLFYPLNTFLRDINSLQAYCY